MARLGQSRLLSWRTVVSGGFKKALIGRSSCPATKMSSPAVPASTSAFMAPTAMESVDAPQAASSRGAARSQVARESVVTETLGIAQPAQAVDGNQDRRGPASAIATR